MTIPKITKRQYLYSVINSAIHDYKSEVFGEVRCAGQEVHDYLEQSCSGKLKYTVKVAIGNPE